MLHALLFVPAILFASGAAFPVKELEFGTFKHGSTEVSSYGEHAIVFAPDTAKVFPMVFFSTGFGGNAPIGMYREILTDIASNGYVIVAIDRMRTPSYVMQGKSFSEVVAWGKTKLNEHLRDNQIASRADPSQIILAGQSAGNHIITEALKQHGTGLCTPEIRALVWIDPVDGVDPLGLDKDQFVIDWEEGNALPDPLTFRLPALHVLTGLDPHTNMGISCAPAHMSNDRFYYAANGPIWQLNYTAYGHLDCLDEDWELIGIEVNLPNVGGIMCPTCETLDGESLKPNCPDTGLYRKSLVKKVVAFMDGILQGGALLDDMRVQLEDTSTFDGLDVALAYSDNGGQEVTNCGCRVLSIHECDRDIGCSYPDMGGIFPGLALSCPRGMYEVEKCKIRGIGGDLTPNNEFCCPNGWVKPQVPPQPTCEGYQVERRYNPEDAVVVEEQQGVPHAVAIAGVGAGVVAVVAGVAVTKNKKRRHVANKEEHLSTDMATDEANL